MKLKPEHVEYLRERIQTVLPKLAAHREALKSDPRVKDLEKRLRWDALWASVPSAWLCANIYPYANDAHIDTALRTIVQCAEMGEA